VRRDLAALRLGSQGRLDAARAKAGDLRSLDPASKHAKAFRTAAEDHAVFDKAAACGVECVWPGLFKRPCLHHCCCFTVASMLALFYLPACTCHHVLVLCVPEGRYLDGCSARLHFEAAKLLVSVSHLSGRLSDGDYARVVEMSRSEELK